MDEIKKTLAAQLEVAPEEIRLYLSNGQWTKTVDNIAPRYSLLPPQKDSLKNEVIFVLLGMELKKNLPQNIQTSLAVPLPIASAIAQSVNEKILMSFEKLLPTEEEATEISPSGAGLLEDAKGNADNFVGIKKEESRISANFSPQNLNAQVRNEIKLAPQILTPTPTSEYKLTEGEPNILKEKFTPVNLPRGNGTPFEKKIADLGLAKEINQIIKKTYPEVDPYRESL